VYTERLSTLRRWLIQLALIAYAVFKPFRTKRIQVSACSTIIIPLCSLLSSFVSYGWNRCYDVYSVNRRKNAVAVIQLLQHSLTFYRRSPDPVLIEDRACVAFTSAIVDNVRRNGLTATMYIRAAKE